MDTSRELISAVKAHSVKKVYDILHRPDTTFIDVMYGLSVSRVSPHFKEDTKGKIHAMLISSSIRLSGQQYDGDLLHEDDRGQEVMSDEQKTTKKLLDTATIRLNAIHKQHDACVKKIYVDENSIEQAEKHVTSRKEQLDLSKVELVAIRKTLAEAEHTVTSLRVQLTDPTS